MKHPLFVLMFFLAAAGPSMAQPYYLDPSAYNPSKDIDPTLFTANWEENQPRIEHGTLVVRDILTPNATGDPFKPARRGEVLRNLTVVSKAFLDVNRSTMPFILKGEQKIFYVTAGEGSVTAGGKTADLRPGVGVFMPAGLEFVLVNTGDVPLEFYIPCEPIPNGFVPRKDMVVKDLNTQPYDSTSGHWVNMTKQLFGREDGLACITNSAGIWLAPMTMAQPHAAYARDVDIVWYAVSEGIDTLLGKQLRTLEPGTCFVNPGDGRFYHANINTSPDTDIHLIWLRASAPGQPNPGQPPAEMRKYYQLDPKPYDPAVDLDPRLFTANWKESVARLEHGNLVMRDLFRPNTSGDPFKPSQHGAVLKRLNYVSVATLAPGVSTVPSTLAGEQKVMYILEGNGRIRAGRDSHEFGVGSAALIPAGLEFILENTGGSELRLYVVSEPVPAGFTPRKNLLVRTERETPYRGPLGHWSNMDTMLFRHEDGFAYITGAATVSIAPRMIPEIHPTNAPEDDVVWFAVQGDVYSLLGKQLFHLEPGTGYVNPGDDRFNHGNINMSYDQFIKMFWVRTQTP